jgi:micrococcal nuclease
MRKRTIVFFVIMACAFVASNYIDSYSEYTVKDVIDGDTFRTSDGKVIRLIGVNSPEIGEPCSIEAKDKLSELIIGKQIRLEGDAGSKDAYGRQLKYVYIDDIFVNSELVRLGLARTEEIKPNVKYSELFQEMESRARSARRCIWE